VFPVDRIALVERYAALLAGPGVVRGLIGPRETARLWERHLLNSAIVAEAVPADSSVADIGSGAGLPGIPLAIARPDLRVTLVEPLLRRATFLQEVVAELGLDSVTVVRARSEELHGRDDLRPGFDVVTSRAVAPLGRLMAWCLPLVAPTGSMVALKGSNAADEVAQVAADLTAWGCATPEVVELGLGRTTETTHAVCLRWRDPASVSWPPARRSGRPARSRRRR
jgi:16S rRNA (guanine527-N7)-methyltransferase